jgi:hypothetical protein
MVGIPALWMPMLVSAAFVLIALAIMHGGLGSHRADMSAVPGTYVTFCCYAVAHWQNWIWWGKSTRFTVTNMLDGIIYAEVAGATFGWLWPR